jgi:tetratricopeptide (TPR) repeat protein
METHKKIALEVSESTEISLHEKVQMLMEIAMGLQIKPKTPQQLIDAVDLYNRAMELCPEDELLNRARLIARRGTALQMIPGPDDEYLQQARIDFEFSIPDLKALGTSEETAEAEMNLGLTIQSLAGMQKAQIGDAISAYQRALRIFNKDNFPHEFVILHNNLATAYLSIPMTDEKAKLREALAVQSFEESLKVVTLVDNPSEYAMLQNNLGNALQYVTSNHPVENNLRALEAYDEALKIRNPQSSPLEYANTISNKANALRNLPDNPEDPEKGNPNNMKQARDYYEEAAELFQRFEDLGKADTINRLLEEMGLPQTNSLSG